MSDAREEPEDGASGESSIAAPGNAEARRFLTGPLAWMAQNPVAANLLMLVLIVGGLMILPRIKQEVFPEFELDLVLINVPYPGASPEEVEQGVLLAVEEAVRSVEGVKEVTATASEGVGVVVVELLFGTNANRALADVKSAVDRITSFPKDVERPIVSLAMNRREVISLVVYGDQDERTLRRLAEEAREALLATTDVTTIELAGVREPEISIEVPRAKLRRYGLTLEAVADAVRGASIELPGGGVKTAGGEVLVRTTERRLRQEDFERIVVVSRPDGSEVRLGEVARIRDTFREIDQEAFFNGRRAVMIKVFRVGAQTPIELADVVKEFAEQYEARLPAGVKLATWSDTSEIYQERINLLLRNAAVGLVLVVGILALFLEIRLAFWVTLGIPISFIGSLLLLPAMDASINMISLFAFIVTLGMVVDDAIVVGEAIYKKRMDGLPFLHAAIAGVREVSAPVVFAILTTMIAFAPMLFVPGPAGKFFRLIPLIVIAVLAISLVEALLILPAHLAHSRPGTTGWSGTLHRRQQRVSRALEWFIARVYAPMLERAVRRRYLTLSVCLALLLATVGLIAGGRLNFTFMPKIEGDVVVAELRLPFGAPADETRRVLDRIVRSAQEILEENGGEARLSRGIFAQLGASGSFAGGARPGNTGEGGSHVGEVAVFMVPVDQRGFGAGELVRKWRARIGEIPGLEHLKFTFDTGPSAGAPIDVRLSHRDLDVLETAAGRVAEALQGYEGVHDIDTGFSPGKEQLDFRLKPGARAVGLTEADLARQVRSAFFGAEAVREQRGRDEVRVFVRLPEEERRSEYDVETLLIRGPGGGEIPLGQAAELKRGRSYTEIKRRDGRRVVSTSADVDDGVTNASKVVSDIEAGVLPELQAELPGLRYSFGGEQETQREVLGSLGNGFVMALLAIFALLAVAFRSYVQPLIVMSVIPFGLIGAVIGHVILGYDLSLMSMMGLVALSGVVVNDSLILIVAVNRYRAQGATARDAICAGGTRRFRPILLTSLTTFFGLMPMILETSFQARFLIPMAVSLGFGVLFATVILLVMVPALYGVLVDAEGAVTALRRRFGRAGGHGGTPAAAGGP